MRPPGRQPGTSDRPSAWHRPHDPGSNATSGRPRNRLLRAGRFCFYDPAGWLGRVVGMRLRRPGQCVEPRLQGRNAMRLDRAAIRSCAVTKCSVNAWISTSFSAWLQFVEVGRQGHPAFGIELTVTVSRIIRRTPRSGRPASRHSSYWRVGRGANISDFGPNVGAEVLPRAMKRKNFGNAPALHRPHRGLGGVGGAVWTCARSCFVSGDGVTEPGMCQFELVLPWAGRCHGDLDPARTLTGTDQRTQLSTASSRIVPQVASANCVCARPMRRKPQSNT